MVCVIPAYLRRIPCLNHIQTSLECKEKQIPQQQAKDLCLYLEALDTVSPQVGLPRAIKVFVRLTDLNLVPAEGSG